MRHEGRFCQNTLQPKQMCRPNFLLSCVYGSHMQSSFQPKGRSRFHQEGIVPATQSCRTGIAWGGRLGSDQRIRLFLQHQHHPQVPKLRPPKMSSPHQPKLRPPMMSFMLHPHSPKQCPLRWLPHQCKNTSIHGNKELPTIDARTPTRENLNFDANVAMNNSSPPWQNSPASSSIVLSSIDIKLLQPQNKNGLFFRPDCTSYCVTKSDNVVNPCNKFHCNVIHVPLNDPGEYVIFPSTTYHRGYYNSDSKKTFFTAQLFAVYKSLDDINVSRTIDSDLYYRLQCV